MSENAMFFGAGIKMQKDKPYNACVSMSYFTAEGSIGSVTYFKN